MVINKLLKYHKFAEYSKCPTAAQKCWLKLLYKSMFVYKQIFLENAD